GGGRELEGVARQPYPQRARPGGEDQGRIHRQGLTVEADLYRGARADLESRCVPLGPPGKPANLTRGLERRELPGVIRVGDHDRHDPWPRPSRTPGCTPECITQATSWSAP